NKVVCLLCDPDLVGGGIEVEFFGETTTLPAGPATLALRTGAPLLPTAVYFSGKGHHAAVREAAPGERRARRARGRAAGRRHPHHPAPGPRARGADPGRAGAVAPPPAQLAQRPGGDRGPRLRRLVRVGLLCPYSLTIPGGVQGQVLGLARALRRMGHETRVLAPCDGPPPDAGVTPLGKSVPAAANG